MATTYNLDKSGVASAIKLRRGDKGRVLTFVVKDDGEPVSLTSRTVVLRATLADGAIYTGSCSIINPSDGIVSYTVDDRLTSVTGACKVSYLALMQGSTVLQTTGDLNIIILADADLTAEEAAQTHNYLAEVQNEWNTLKTDVNRSISGAKSAASNANAAAGKTTAAINDAKDAADKAREAAGQALSSIDQPAVFFFSIGEDGQIQINRPTEV